MSQLLEFQKAHGDEWGRIVRKPAFLAALTILNSEKIQSIADLTNEDIKNHGIEILADLRGHFKHENDLVSIHEKRIFDLEELPDETYAGEEEPVAKQGKPKKKPKKT